MSEERPNVVLVTVDSLRADHCGFMGYEADTTPNLDELAEDGVVFENAVAPAPFTEQSMPAAFTGAYPAPADADDYGAHVEKHQFLPEILSRRGYETAGFSPNPFASREYSFDRGFDEFWDFLGDESRGDVYRTLLSRLKSGDLVEALRLGANMAGYNVPGLGNQSIPLRSYYDLVLDWIEDAEEPFFLWLFLLEVHSPYRPTRQYRPMSFPRMLRLNFVRSNMTDRDPTDAETERLLSLYDGSIRMTDAIVRDLLDDLEEYDPAFVFHSDHGESFGEHGNYGHEDFMYEENLHVPFFVANVADSGRVEDPVSLRALPEVVRRIADGDSLTGPEIGSEHALARVDHSKAAVRGRDWKYLLEEDAGRMFDLGGDPDELQPTSDDERNERALAALQSHVEHDTERQRISEAADDFESP